MKRLWIIVVLCMVFAIPSISFGQTSIVDWIISLTDDTSPTSDDSILVIDASTKTAKEVSIASLFGIKISTVTTDALCKGSDGGIIACTTTSLTGLAIGGGTASRNAEWDGDGYLTSSNTATTGTGAPVKAVSPTLTSLPKVVLTNNTTNEYYGGTAVYFAQCAASMGFGQPAYIQSTGKPGLADGDGVATMPAIGLVVVASTDADTPCTILTHGVITDTDWNWTVGNTIYVADGDAGALTATVGDISDTNDVVQVMGIAIHADSIFVNPSLTTIVLE
jgi:hypothetical protein